MAGEHAEIALGARRVHLIDLACEKLSLGRDKGEMQLLRHHASDAIFSALATASSIVPTMRKAVSGRWSYSPSHTALNERMVSSNGTKMPGILVKASATCIGWDRNCVILRARATVSLSSSESSSIPRMAIMSFSSLYFCRIA